MEGNSIHCLIMTEIKECYELTLKAVRAMGESDQLSMKAFNQTS